MKDFTTEQEDLNTQFIEQMKKITWPQKSLEYTK